MTKDVATAEQGQEEQAVVDADSTGSTKAEAEAERAGDSVQEALESAADADACGGVDGADVESSGDEGQSEAETSSDDASSNDAETIAQLESELAAAIAERDETIDKLQRTAAEFQNARRRQETQLSEAINRANAGLIARILPILDDFDLAFQNLPQIQDEDAETPSDQAWVAGFRQIQKKLLDLLEEEGVTPIDADGEFDPMRHEAVLSEESDEVESGHIIGVLRTGYELKGQVLRPAMVRVAS